MKIKACNSIRFTLIRFKYFIFPGRVTITQTGAISIFSSKEQELEQRAGMMKRLAFTIFCSEPDQYQKSMPDIQGIVATLLLENFLGF